MKAKADIAIQKLFGLVRNKDGQPQFDDFENIPEVFHASLTAEDWVYINEKRKEQCH